MTPMNQNPFFPSGFPVSNVVTWGFLGLVGLVVLLTLVIALVVALVVAVSRGRTHTGWRIVAIVLGVVLLLPPGLGVVLITAYSSISHTAEVTHTHGGSSFRALGPVDLREASATAAAASVDFEPAEVSSGSRLTAFALAAAVVLALTALLNLATRGWFRGQLLAGGAVALLVVAALVTPVLGLLFFSSPQPVAERVSMPPNTAAQAGGQNEP